MAIPDEQTSELIAALKELVEELKIDRTRFQTTQNQAGSEDSEARRRMENIVPTARTTKEPNQVVRAAPEILIAGYSTQAIHQQQAISRDDDEWLEKEEKKGKGWLEKIFSPGMLLLLGGLAALVTGVLSFKDDIADFLGDLGSGGFEKIKNLMLDTLDLRRIPIVGGIISFVDSYQAFQKGEWGIGLGHLFSGLVNTVGWAVLGPFAGVLSWGIDMLVSFLEGEGEGASSEDVVQDTGFDIWENIGRPMWDFLAPILKFIPIIGSFVWFAEAKTAFSSGGIDGFATGLLSLFGGLVVNFPLFGQLASAGVQVLIGIIKGEDKQPDPEKGWNIIDDLAMPMYNSLKPVIRYIPVIGSFIYAAEAVNSFANKKWAVGLLQFANSIAVMFPWMGTAIAAGVQVMISLFDTEDAKEPIVAKSRKGFFARMSDGILDTARKWWGKLGNGWLGKATKWTMRKLFPKWADMLDESGSTAISDDQEMLGQMDLEMSSASNTVTKPDNSLAFTDSELNKMTTSSLYALLKYSNWGDRDSARINAAILRQGADPDRDLGLSDDIKTGKKNADAKKPKTLANSVLDVFSTFDKFLEQWTGQTTEDQNKEQTEKDEQKTVEQSKLENQREIIRLQRELNDNIVTSIREGGNTINNSPVYSTTVGSPPNSTISASRNRFATQHGRK